MSASPALANPYGSSLSNEPLTAFVSDEQTRAIIQEAAERGWPSGSIHDGGLPAALGALSQEPSTPLLVVDVSGTDDPALGLRSLLTLCDHDTRIVLIGSVNDVGLYRDLLAAGAADYLVKPITADMLITALENTHRPKAQEPEDEKKTPVVVTIGTRGGVGASTIAVNMGWIMSHELGKTVALIDLDIQFGTIALALDLEPSHGLREAFENPDRIDGLFIASAMVHESEKLFVLSAEEPLEDEVHINPGAFELLLGSLPADFDYIVVDLPQKLAIAQRRLLAIADQVILVSDLSLAGMRDTVRLAQLVREAAPRAAINVVVNRVGSVKKGELPKQEFQRSTELPVKQFLPHDPTVAVAAANAGKPFPLIAKNSQIVKEFRKLTEMVCGGPAAQKRKPGMDLKLGKMFKKKK